MASYPDPGPTRAVRGLLCRELIGRDQVLDTARTALAEAQRGAGGVVFVSGEAGVGKSRLVGEIVTAARDSGVQVLFGRGVQADVPVPFRPFSEALLSHFRNQGLPDLPGLSPFRPALGRLLPEWRTPGETTHEPPVVLAEGVVRLLTAVAGESAVLLVLEDLHWADQETLAVLEYLVDALRTQPVLCVGTVRSEEAEPRRCAWQRADGQPDRDRPGDRPADDRRARTDDGRLPGLGRRTDRGGGLRADLVRRAAVHGGGGARGRRRRGALGLGRRTVVVRHRAGPSLPGLRRQRARPAARARPRAARAGGWRPSWRRFDWTLLPTAAPVPDLEVMAALRVGVDVQLAGRRAAGRSSASGKRDPGRRARRPAARRAWARLRRRASTRSSPRTRGCPAAWCEVAAGLAERSGSTSARPGCCCENARWSLRRVRWVRRADPRPGQTATSDAALEATSTRSQRRSSRWPGRPTRRSWSARRGGRPAPRDRRSRRPVVRTPHLGVARAAVTACVWTSPTST